MWNRKYYIIYALCRLKLSLWALTPEWECPPQTAICFQFLHFSLWCKHQEWGNRACWPLPEGLLHPDHWWHLGVILKCSEEHLFFFRNMGVSLRTKHRFSITLYWSWCRLWLDIREVGALSVTMQPVPALTTLSWPNTVSHERRIDPKKNKIILGKRFEKGSMAWRKLPMIFFFFEERELQGKGLRDQTKVSREWNSVEPKGLVMLEKN